jgi:membrane protease YdiL (CAAX protease family)
MAGVVPIGEEILFRGYAFERLHRAGGPAVAYAVSTLLFALVHLNPSAILIYLYLGLVLAWVYHQSQGLLAPITAHAINNGVALLLLLTRLGQAG